MIVCLCRRVSDRDIQRAARDGVTSFDELQSELGIGTACGSCIDCAQRSFAEACAHARAQAPGVRRSFEIRALPA